MSIARRRGQCLHCGHDFDAENILNAAPQATVSHEGSARSSREPAVAAHDTDVHGQFGGAAYNPMALRSAARPPSDEEPPVLFSAGKWVYMGDKDTPVSEHDSRELDAAAWHKLKAIPSSEPAPSGWIPVGERLPTASGWFQVWTTEPTSRLLMQQVPSCYFDSSIKSWRPGGFRRGQITHWMPLPDAPGMAPVSATSAPVSLGRVMAIARQGSSSGEITGCTIRTEDGQTVRFERTCSDSRGEHG